jgi:8-oxo-dGTP pyrophosphatase MutT (NUDIX family)
VLRDAAVLIPTWRDEEGELRLVLIRRSPHGAHGGQLGFPGGKLEPEETGRAAALREAEEEIGLTQDRVEIVEALPVFRTLTTAWRVQPFLSRIRRPADWELDPREVAEVLEPRVQDLADPAARGIAVEDFGPWQEPQETPHLKVEGRRLWGVTYRILEPLLPRIVAGEWEL